jgi:hypothetical protein
MKKSAINQFANLFFAGFGALCCLIFAFKNPTLEQSFFLAGLLFVSCLVIWFLNDTQD